MNNFLTHSFQKVAKRDAFISLVALSLIAGLVGKFGVVGFRQCLGQGGVVQNSLVEVTTFDLKDFMRVELSFSL